MFFKATRFVIKLMFKAILMSFLGFGSAKIGEHILLRLDSRAAEQIAGCTSPDNYMHKNFPEVHKSVQSHLR